MTLRGIKEHFQRDVQAFRELKGHRRWEFIWDYYKIPIITVLSLVLLFTLAGLLNLGHTDAIMYTILVNADQEAESTLFDDLLTRGGVDLQGKTVSVITAYKLGGEFSEVYDVETLQVLAAEFAIGDLDLFGADEKVFASYADKDAFVDLSLFIEAEILDRYREDLYIYKNTDGVEIVGGVRLREGSPLHRAGYYYDDMILGIVSNAQNLDEAIVAVKQLLLED